jgi:hypothetical protein
MPMRPFRAHLDSLSSLTFAVALVAAGCSRTQLLAADAATEPVQSPLPVADGGDLSTTGWPAVNGYADAWSFARPDSTRWGDGGPLDATDPAFGGGDFCSWDSKFRRTVELDDRSLGYSALDVAEMFAANGPGVLQWFDGTQTILRISADVSMATAHIDDPPPYQGYCPRLTELWGVTFAVNTDDGRLHETTVSSLTGVDDGATILSVWPELRFEVPQLSGSLSVPAEWVLPEQTHWILFFTVNSRLNVKSPYCASKTVPDETPLSTCTNKSGKIVYGGYKSEPLGAPDDRYTVEKLVGEWRWQ